MRASIQPARYAHGSKRLDCHLAGREILEALANTPNNGFLAERDKLPLRIYKMTILSSSGTALSHALSTILPTPEDTLLLRACLTPGESGKLACEAWLKQHQNGFKKEAIKAFLPLFLHAVKKHAVKVDAAFLTVLRTAVLREELRTNTYNRICCELFSALSDYVIPTIVLGGAALADTVYAHPALRHSHDIDVLIPDVEFSRTERLIASLRFKSVNLPEAGSQHWEFKHASGLPLQLHSRLFQLSSYTPPLTEIWSRSHNLLNAGVPVRTLSPVDSLLYVCGHASYSSSRHSLRWVSDGWFIIDGYPDLDWDLLLDCAGRSRLALPLSVMLGYLAEDLSAPIPSECLGALSATAANSHAMERQTLGGTSAVCEGSLKESFRRATN